MPRRTPANSDKQRSATPIARGFSIRTEGWCYLTVLTVMFVGALIRDINLLMLLFGMLAGPLVYSLWYGWFALRHLDVSRTLPDFVHAGQPFEVTVELTNRRRWFGVWAIVVQDAIRRPDGAVAPQEAGTLFLYVGAGKSRKLTYQVQLLERGRYEFGPLVVSTRFPLGLFRRFAVLARVDKLVVWPRLGELTALSRPGADLADQVSRQMHRQRGMVEGDFYGLRDWRSGDSRRWIHWPTSARTGELMVRQFERHRAPDLAVVVDLWQPTYPTGEQRDNTELAVSLAATLVADTCRKGGSMVTLAISGRRDRIVRGAASTGMLQQMLSELAVAEPSPDDHLYDVCARLLGVMRAGTRTVVVTTRHVDLTNPGLLPHALRDPRVGQWLRQIAKVETHLPSLTDYFQPS
jgi:uncharacterized protein (DUF58 family)